jgi:hypothetical protein
MFELAILKAGTPEGVIRPRLLKHGFQCEIAKRIRGESLFRGV